MSNVKMGNVFLENVYFELIFYTFRSIIFFLFIGSVQTLFPASMWTRKDIDEFKANLLRESGEAVIKVNHGETVTVNILISIKIHFTVDNY